MKAMTLTHGATFGATLGAATSRPFWRRLLTALQVAGERRALAHLDARMLNDIGVNEDTAAREAARPIWDVPASR